MRHARIYYCQDLEIVSGSDIPMREGKEYFAVLKVSLKPTRGQEETICLAPTEKVVVIKQV